MELDIREADFSDPAHRAAIVDVLDSYACDPVGGGKPLTTEVRERLVPALQSHPTTLVLLAFVRERAGRVPSMTASGFPISSSAILDPRAS